MKQQSNKEYDKLTGLAIFEHPIYLSRNSALKVETNSNKAFKKDPLYWISNSSIIKKEKANYKVDKQVCKEIVQAILNSTPRMNFNVILTKNYYE